MIDKGSKDVNLHKSVREYYAAAITEKTAETSCGCCCGGGAEETSCCGDTQLLYEDEAVNQLPREVTSISFGCGDPVTLASLKPGEVVLDLGSGGGIDCFLAAKNVGEKGFVIGVDMTPQMVDRARANSEKVGVKNVEFRLGEIEHLPVTDVSVDVVISNCVINLSPNKPQVFSEIYRVLKPGGRIAVSDILTDGELPDAIKSSLSAWAGCVAGAVDRSMYLGAIEDLGFVDVNITATYFADEMLAEAIDKIDDPSLMELDFEALKKTVYSAKITATKPV